LEGRKALAFDTVPEPYLDALARLHREQPPNTSTAGWQQAIANAGLFLDEWGAGRRNSAGPPLIYSRIRASSTPLTWSGAFKAAGVTSIGPGRAVINPGNHPLGARKFDRETMRVSRESPLWWRASRRGFYMPSLNSRRRATEAIRIAMRARLLKDAAPSEKPTLHLFQPQEDLPLPQEEASGGEHDEAKKRAEGPSSTTAP
jgi:hypothetical protein